MLEMGKEHCEIFMDVFLEFRLSHDRHLPWCFWSCIGYLFLLKTIYCVTVVFGEIFIEQRRSEKVGANQAYGETGGD